MTYTTQDLQRILANPDITLATDARALEIVTILRGEGSWGVTA